MDFANIINHPDFGRLYSSSPGFRSRVMNQFKGLEGLADIIPTLNMSMNDRQQLIFSIANDARAIPRGAGESNLDYFQKAIEQARQPYSRVRQYKGLKEQPFSSTQTGGFRAKRLSVLSELYGVNFSVGSVPTANRELRDLITERYGDDALIIPDSDTTNVLRAFDAKTNKPLTFNQILETLGVDANNKEKIDSVFKRLKAFINETEAERVFTGGSRAQVGVFSAQEIIAANPIASQRLAGFMAEAGGGSMDKLAEMALDGSSLMSRSAFNRIIGQTDEDISNLRGQLNRLTPGTASYRKAQKKIADLESSSRRLQSRFDDGLSFSFRAFGSQNAFTGTDVEFVKGEVLGISDDRFLEIGRKLNPNLTDDELLSLDFITADVNIKAKELGLTQDFKAGKKGVGFITLNPESLPKQARSNTLTTATMGGFIDKDGYLTEGLNLTIRNHLNKIKETGQIPEGLKAIINDLANMPVEGLSPAEIVAKQEAKDFAYKIQAFAESGGDLRNNPSLLKQLTRQLDSQYFAMSKKTDTYKFLGGDTPALNGRFPMLGSTLAHLEPTAMTQRSDVLPGVLRPDYTAGRFPISERDAVKTHRAFGGFDFDDSIYNFYRYDKKTKRLLSVALRDPNAMGEYYIFDADISMDRNIPEAVRRDYARHQELTKELANTNKAGARKPDVTNKLRELNRIKSKLDRYFQGLEVGDYVAGTQEIYGTKTASAFIKEIDMSTLYDRGLPAPSGTRFDRSRATFRSYTRSMHQLPTANVEGTVGNIRSEMARVVSGADDLSFFKAAPDALPESIAKYYKPVDLPGAGNRRGSLSLDLIRDRLDQEMANNGTLGRTINQYTALDQFITTHMDFFGDASVDSRLRDKLGDLLKTYQLERIDREILIDALVKDSSPEVIEAAQRGLSGNMENLGHIIRELQAEAKALGIDTEIGLDPKVFEERLIRDSEQVSALRRGFGADEGFLLSAADVKATEARAFAAQLASRENFAKIFEDEVATATDNLSKIIGDDFSARELAEASDIISEYNESLRLEKMSRSIDIEDYLSGKADTRFLDTFSKRAAHGRLLSRFEGKSRRDVLAVARVLIDSGASLDMLDQAVPVQFGSSERSMAKLFGNAIREDSLVSEIQNVTNMEDLGRYISLGSDGGYELTDTSLAAIDQRRVHQALGKAVRRVHVHGDGAHAGWEVASEALGRFGGGEPTTIHIGKSSEAVSAKQYGELAASMRAHADGTADMVARKKPYGELMRRLSFKDVQNSRSIRSGLMVAGAFVGVGIAHRLIKGDRSVDDMNPYPLIPQDSNYESILKNGGITADEYSSNGSMSYRVRVTGASQDQIGNLSNSLQGVLGQGSTTIYKSNAYNSGYNNSSLDILNERLS